MAGSHRTSSRAVLDLGTLADIFVMLAHDEQCRFRLVGCVAGRPSIQLNALRDERVLFVDFNGMMKNFMFVCSLSCLNFLFRLILQSPGTYKSIIMTRSAPSRAEYKCDAAQNIIDRVCKVIKFV